MKLHFAVMLLASASTLAPAFVHDLHGQDLHRRDLHRHHPAADVPLHEKFYSTWYMPDNPGKSCCNKADCYPTEITYRDGDIYAKRREDGKWLRIPATKIEQRRDNPDGRNHLCAPPPTAAHYPPDTVFCFALGAGI